MEKKKLIMVAGSAGVGKSVVCKELFKRINGSAWLDGELKNKKHIRKRIFDIF